MRQAVTCHDGPVYRVRISPLQKALDEPFNALDYKTYEDIKTIIRMLKAEGKTIFLTSHHFKDIE